MVFSFQNFKESHKATGDHYAVIGHPISHSLSPVMHQTALDYHGIEAVYVALDVRQSDLTEFIAWCNRDHFRGCNITLPYKKQLLNMVDLLDESAKELQAMNTIVKEGGKLVGYNTDLHGFITPLEPYEAFLDGGRAIVFGTGGAAKAVLGGLERLGYSEVVVVSRRPHERNVKTDSLSVVMAGYENWTVYAEEASMIVNTTPLGMHPDIDRCPVKDHEAPFLADSVCYDLVYNPLKTRFLRLAESQGAETLNGIEMLIHQGNRSFELWTGKQFPLSLVHKALLKQFER
jgi:shikimate dehydrogenase